VRGWDRTILDKLHQFVPLLRVEPWRLAWRLGIHQPGWSGCVEPQNPVPEGLQPNPTCFGAFAPRAAAVDYHKRQQAPRLISILGSLRQCPEPRCVVVIPL
jgi:hypothetical protein